MLGYHPIFVRMPVHRKEEKEMNSLVVPRPHGTVGMRQEARGKTKQWSTG